MGLENYCLSRIDPYWHKPAFAKRRACRRRPHPLRLMASPVGVHCIVFNGFQWAISMDQWLFSEHTKTEAVYLGPWQNQFARTFLEHANEFPQFSLQSRHLQNDLFEK